MLIPFNQPANFKESINYINKLLAGGIITSNNNYTKKCESFLQDRFGYNSVLLTSSCTAALEICALIIKKYSNGKNEIIMPSYTFVSSANAFAKFGFKIIFVDVKKDMNMNEEIAISAINNNTAAILAVNYGGFSPNLEILARKCKEKNIFFVEDNAQGIDSKYNKKYLGSFGDFSTFSFHETKNITSGGEGGALVCNNIKYIEDAKIIREKGTNREQFFRGIVSKYSWVDFGGNYLMSEIQAAFLLGQLEHLDEITDKRQKLWQIYYDGLQLLVESGIIEIQQTSPSHQYNGHLFYIKCKNLQERSRLIKYLKKFNISAVFHYIPLHSSLAGKKYGAFYGEDKFTTIESNKLLRLPIYFKISNSIINNIIKKIIKFYVA